MWRCSSSQCYSIDAYSYPYTTTTLFLTTVALKQILKSESVSLQTNFFFFKINLTVLGPLHFKISLSISAQKPAGILAVIALNL